MYLILLSFVAPGDHPLNFTGYALNSTHIFLNWSPPSEEDTNGVIREYRINITEHETNILYQLTINNSTTETVVGPFHPFYIYHCTILAFTVEEGPSSSVVSIRTKQDGREIVGIHVANKIYSGVMLFLCDHETCLACHLFSSLWATYQCVSYGYRLPFNEYLVGTSSK